MFFPHDDDIVFNFLGVIVDELDGLEEQSEYVNKRLDVLG